MTKASWRAVALVLIGVMLAACGTADHPAVTKPSPSPDAVNPSASNPFAGRSMYVRADSKASQASAAVSGDDQALIRQIAQTPTAIWLTPEEFPTTTVEAQVRAQLAAAGPSVATFVLYGIPDRDCTGGHSSGGLDATTYLDWVRAIAAAVQGDPAIILEPDALASAADCGLLVQREEILSLAVGILVPVAAVYVDAGHANWIPGPEMAARLSAIGAERTRGFALNVSGYGTDEAQRGYADQILSAFPGAHYVIDSSRNGVGSDDWCNPPGQALGQTPAVSTDGTALDAHLWIKPPGESDGTCQGGPAAGTFWVQRAAELARHAGWKP